MNTFNRISRTISSNDACVDALLRMNIAEETDILVVMNTIKKVQEANNALIVLRGIFRKRPDVHREPQS